MVISIFCRGHFSDLVMVFRQELPFHFQGDYRIAFDIFPTWFQRRPYFKIQFTYFFSISSSLIRLLYSGLYIR